MQKNRNIQKMVLLAMLAAVSYLLVTLVRIPVVIFLKYEPKDVVITIAGFLLGPASSFVISLVVSLLEMLTISDTGPIGALMNLLSSCSFACVAALIYKRKHNLKGAIAGLLLGSVAMIIIMLLWNWLITPWYMNVPRQEVQAMLIPAFLPFNALKAGFNTALVLGLYKPLTSALRKTKLVPAVQSSPKSRRPGLYIAAGILLATCVLLLLALKGII